MKDIDANEAMAMDALFNPPRWVTGAMLTRQGEIQQIYDRFPNVWSWVDMTVANLPEVPDLILSFVYFKLLKLLSEANESQLEW
ncbi:unnamed protein product [marine sediment metagenome]|uniref:Uncharacterized protein n=1 Tax=marine sediment metagenome TaxID=412755 RepID=X1DSY1_9ZZZZ